MGHEELAFKVFLAAAVLLAGFLASSLMTRL
jgi:hypothetical protein